MIFLKLSAIFTSTLRDDQGEWDLELKKGLNPFQTNCRVVSEKEAILLLLGSLADLCSNSLADLRSCSAADYPLSLSADQPLSSAADQPLSSSAAVSLSSNYAHPLTLQGLQLKWTATTAKNDDKKERYRLPCLDVSVTLLHGGLDSTRQVTK